MYKATIKNIKEDIPTNRNNNDKNVDNYNTSNTEIQ